MKIKIKGIQNNQLRLIIDDISVGSLDIDHNKVDLFYTESEFKRKFDATAKDLNYEICEYYNELHYKENEITCETEYEIRFEEEE